MQKWIYIVVQVLLVAILSLHLLPMAVPVAASASGACDSVGTAGNIEVFYCVSDLISPFVINSMGFMMWETEEVE